MRLNQITIIVPMIMSVISCAERLPASTQVYEALFASLGENEHTFFIREEPTHLPSDELSDELRKLYSGFRFPKEAGAHSKTDFGSL